MLPDQPSPQHRFHVPQRISAFIENGVVPAAAHLLPIAYPATEAEISVLEEADEAMVDRAVRAARLAFDEGPWRRSSVGERQALLRQVSTLVRNNAEELAYLECLNSGISMRHLVNGQIPRAAYNFDFFSEFIGQAAGQIYSQDLHYMTMVVREPIGVAGLIGPWNAPLALTSMKIASCIAFGNCCVVKPAERTPLAVARLMELLRDAGLPKGVVNMVNGRGNVTGDALVRHPGVDLISFTGGTSTGKAIMAAAGAGLKPCSLELGGKSANVIFASADLDKALDGALLGIYANNGQQCLAGSRILLERSIAPDFIKAFVERTKRIKVGDPMDPATEIGPLAFAEHLDRVLSFVDIAQSDGAEVLVGGHRAPGFARGHYMAPTAVLAPSNDTRICQEEVFGPFATFVIFDTVEEAIRIANQSSFGLVSYVWTKDMATAMTASHGIRSGVVWINTPMVRELRAPFGGFKESGMGREGGASCMHFYTGEKTITMPIDAIPIPRIGLGV